MHDCWSHLPYGSPRKQSHDDPKSATVVHNRLRYWRNWGSLAVAPPRYRRTPNPRTVAGSLGARRRNPFLAISLNFGFLDITNGGHLANARNLAATRFS